MEQNLFIKKYSVLPCTLATIFFLIGVVGLFIDNAVFFILGFLIIAFSAIYFFTGAKRWYSPEKKKFFTRKEVFLKKERQVYIEGLLGQKDLKGILKEEVDFCSNLKVVIWESRDKKECYAQLFNYIPHEYEPISEIVTIF